MQCKFVDFLSSSVNMRLMSLLLFSRTTYRDKNGHEFTDKQVISLPAVSAETPDSFGGSAVRKGVLLTRYVKFVKRMLEDSDNGEKREIETQRQRKRGQRTKDKGEKTEREQRRASYYLQRRLSFSRWYHWAVRYAVTKEVRSRSTAGEAASQPFGKERPRQRQREGASESYRSSSSFSSMRVTCRSLRSLQSGLRLSLNW